MNPAEKSNEFMERLRARDEETYETYRRYKYYKSRAHTAFGAMNEIISDDAQWYIGRRLHSANFHEIMTVESLWHYKVISDSGHLESGLSFNPFSVLGIKTVDDLIEAYRGYSTPKMVIHHRGSTTSYDENGQQLKGSFEEFLTRRLLAEGGPLVLEELKEKFWISPDAPEITEVTLDVISKAIFPRINRILAPIDFENLDLVVPQINLVLYARLEKEKTQDLPESKKLFQPLVEQIGSQSNGNRKKVIEYIRRLTRFDFLLTTEEFEGVIAKAVAGVEEDDLEVSPEEYYSEKIKTLADSAATPTHFSRLIIDNTEYIDSEFMRLFPDEDMRDAWVRSSTDNEIKRLMTDIPLKDLIRRLRMEIKAYEHMALDASPENAKELRRNTLHERYGLYLIDIAIRNGFLSTKQET